MDAVHPQHNPVVAYGWIKHGQEHEVPSNTGRRRVNINGATNVEDLEPVVRFDETINAESTIALFEQLEEVYALATWIYVICDNARYYRSKAVQEYLEGSRIKLVFLPPYAPNLNLIERLWKFFKKQVLYNRYYESFDTFRKAISSVTQLAVPLLHTVRQRPRISPDYRADYQGELRFCGCTPPPQGVS